MKIIVQCSIDAARQAFVKYAERSGPLRPEATKNLPGDAAQIGAALFTGLLSQFLTVDEFFSAILLIDQCETRADLVDVLAGTSDKEFEPFTKEVEPFTKEVVTP